MGREGKGRETDGVGREYQNHHHLRRDNGDNGSWGDVLVDETGGVGKRCLYRGCDGGNNGRWIGETDGLM